MKKASKEIKGILQRLSKTDSRKEYAELKNKLGKKVRNLFDMIDGICREIGTEPPWNCLINTMCRDRICFSAKSDLVLRADVSCYGTKDVEIFSMTASDGTVENDIPVELPWFDLGKTGWRKKLLDEKRKSLEKEIIAAQIRLDLARDRLVRFNERHK